jgi:hypothetical protein
MAETSAYTAGGPEGVRKLNKQKTQKGTKFRAANGYMGQAPGGMFKKGKGNGRTGRA